MIQKIILGVLLISSTLFAQAQKAILLDVISENILEVEYKGKVQKIHLVGLNLFAKANNATRDVSLDAKDEFKKQSIDYIKENLKIGSLIKYYILNEGESGAKKVWLHKDELNYKIVRDGYALVDLDDPYLPTKFKMRMTIAMNYAKNRALGMWGTNNKQLLALIDTKKHMCGWKNTNAVLSITKLAILKEQQNALPKSVRTPAQTYIALR